MKNFIASVFGAPMIVSMFALAWFAWFEPPYVTYQTPTFPVLRQSVKAGEQIPLLLKRCNSDSRQHSYIVATVLVRLDDPAQLPIGLPAIITTLGVGCSTVESRRTIIPPTTPAGRYVLEFNSEINGTLRTFSMGRASEPFTVERP